MGWFALERNRIQKIANIWYKYTIDILRALAGETQPNPSPSSTPNTTKTIKIMPVGDSCTEGMGGGEMVLTVRNCTDC